MPLSTKLFASSRSRRNPRTTFDGTLERWDEVLRTGKLDVQLQAFLDGLDIAEHLVLVTIQVSVDGARSPAG